MGRFQKSLCLVGLALVPFFVARLALVLIHSESFAVLSAREAALALLYGLRFDLNIILVAMVAPLAMMNLPLPFLGRRWFNGWAWIAFVPLTPLAIVLAGDVIYFGHVQRHLADELLKLGSDFDFVTGEALTAFLPVLLGVLAGMFGLALAWKRVLAGELRPTRFPILTFAVLAAACVVGIRGSIDRKPVGLIDAYRTGSTAFGNLSLNGVFSAYRASSDTELVEYRFFDDATALAQLGLEDGEYPVLRSNPEAEPTNLNLVMILLESWDVKYSDSYDAGGRGVTPNFDALAARGLRFENFYASSQRSVEGIQAILTGVPPIRGMPTIGWGLKLANLTQVGSVAQRNGYETLFVQSSMRRSYRLDAVAKSLGFEHFYGWQDIPMRLDYPPPQTAKWGWDYETLMFALDRIDDFEDRFLALVFTGSTHSPYPDPGPRFRDGEHQAHGERGFADVLRYSDWSLGEFFREAQTRPWFDDTVFLVFSDHVWRSAPTDDIRDEFRIPFVLFAPGRVAPGVETRVGSHLDCLATVFEILGFRDAYATLGRSLLAEETRFALLKKGNLMGIVSDEAAVTHSLETRLEASGTEGKATAEDYDALERRLLASIQLTSELLRSNRWAPGAAAALPDVAAGGRVEN